MSNKPNTNDNSKVEGLELKSFGDESNTNTEVSKDAKVDSQEQPKESSFDSKESEPIKQTESQKVMPPNVTDKYGMKITEAI